MRGYFVNFFIWWYWIVVRNKFQSAWFNFIYWMNLTNALPMVKNLFRPLFGDNSKLGLIVGIFIRFWWAGIGTIISIVLNIPYFIFASLTIFLPFIPVLMTLIFLTQQL